MDAVFEADAFEILTLDIPEAHVVLRPHDEADRVHVHGAVPHADPEQAQQVFDRKNISAHQSGDRLQVHGDALSSTVEDWRWRQRLPTTVRLVVHLPPALAVEAILPGGSVKASGLAGAVNLTVNGGSVHAANLQGPLQVRGSSGPLAVTDSDAPLSLDWAGGEVTLSGARDEVMLRTRAAPTTLSDTRAPVEVTVHGAPLSLQNVNGPCDATVHGASLTYRAAPQSDVALRVVGGPLHAHLPASQQASISLSGTRVTLDDAFAFEGTRAEQRVTGTLQGGGASLDLQAIQGLVACHAQESPH